MESYYIDKSGDNENREDDDNEFDVGVESDDSDNFVDDEVKGLFDDTPFTREVEVPKNKKKINKFTLDDTYLITNYMKEKEKLQAISNVDKLMKKSSLEPGLEKKLSLASVKRKKAEKLERKKIRELTKGDKWFNIPATEVTDEIKNDIEILKMRSILDSKSHYKKNTITNIQKYFQVGTVVEGPADFYSGRIVKSQRKKTLVEELLADAEFKRYQKKKYKEIMDVNRRKKKGAKGKDSSGKKNKR